MATRRHDSDRLPDPTASGGSGEDDRGPAIGGPDPVLAAVTATLDQSEFAGLYIGPVWEVPRTETATSSTAPSARKIAILRRVPGHGAVHLGHLFLVEGGEGSTVVPDRSTFPGSSRRAGEPVLLVAGLPEWVPFRLFARPTTAATAPELERFCTAVVKAVLGRPP